MSLRNAGWWNVCLRKLCVGLLLATLLPLGIAGCGDGKSSTKEEDESAPPTISEQVEAQYPLTPGCNLGAGADFVVFQGKTYTQKTNCTADVLAYYDASENTLNLLSDNNLFGLGSGDSMIFDFVWQATGDVGVFLSPPEFLFLQDDGHIYLCGIGAGAVTVTRRDDVGGIVAGSYAFTGISIPYLCPFTSLTGSFNAHREHDFVSGSGTYASPVMLTVGAPPVAGNVRDYGTGNFAFTATATKNVISLKGMQSNLDWAAYSHKPNLGDSALQVCHHNDIAGDEVCSVGGLTVGKTYYLQVVEQDGVAGTYQISVN